MKNMNDQQGREARLKVNDTDEGVFQMLVCDSITSVRQDIWHGMTSDGSVVALEEDIVRKQFGDMFVNDCK